jgi:hypothetical protein
MAGPGLGNKLHGKRAAVYLGGPIGTGVKITNKTEWTLNLGRDYVDATVFGDANKTYLVGLRDIQGQFNGLLDVSGDYLVNASSSDVTSIYLYADDTGLNSTGAPILAAYGPGFLDAAITASNSDAEKCSGNFRASGAWIVFSAGSL